MPAESRPAYLDELEALPRAYADGLGVAVAATMNLLDAALGANGAMFVASGGALPVAKLAADIHTHRTGSLSIAATPLQAMSALVPRDLPIVVISSRASHPDIANVLRHARTYSRGDRHLVTNRPPHEIAATVALATSLTPLPPLLPREGFLATRSVMMQATAFASRIRRDMPLTLPTTAIAPRAITNRVLLLHGPRTLPAATDLETRLSELGLSAVQVADYRNFAHGRHVGLHRQGASTTIVALTEPYDWRLAEATLSLLPSRLSVVRLHSDLEWPAAVIDLLGQSMRLTGLVARNAGIEPSRPRVQPFGRRLYHLSSARLLPESPDSPALRKARSDSLYPLPGVVEAYSRALAQWLDAIRDVRFRAIVLDYDGTVCDTALRYSSAPIAVQRQLIRVLRQGVEVGFATGRGHSLVDSLRSWLPTDLWPSVTLGLYNGSLLGKLSDELRAETTVHPAIAQVEQYLAETPIVSEVARSVRPSQISIQRSQIVDMYVEPILASVLLRVPTPLVKLLRSGHSLDIVPAGGKASVVNHMALRSDSPVLAIGDQGNLGGNDEGLLAATPWSLSVDQCSSDPTRCWNLLPPGMRGAAGVQRYLGALRGKGSMRFAWRHAE